MNTSILNYVVIETIIMSVFMWTIAPKVNFKKYKTMLLSIPLIFVFLLIIPITNIFTVALYAAFLIALRRYFFNASLRSAAQQVVVIFIMKYLIVYLAAFVFLIKTGSALTAAQFNVSTQFYHINWVIFYLIIIILEYRIVVNRMIYIHDMRFFSNLPVVLTTLVFAAFLFLSLNQLYRYTTKYIAAILKIPTLGFLMVVLINVFIILLAVVTFLFNSYWITKTEFSDFQLLAEIDELTGLLTRTSGMKRLEQTYRKAFNNYSNFVLCFIDLNNLKYINDRFGHEAGDNTIKTVATVIRRELRDTDYAFRYGGDEFIIVFDNCKMQDARSAWQRINKEIEVVNIKQSFDYDISVSHGMASHHQNRRLSLAKLLKLADQEMYKCKNRIGKVGT